MRLLGPDWLQHHSRMEKIEPVHSFSNARIESSSNRNCDRRLLKDSTVIDKFAGRLHHSPLRLLVTDRSDMGGNSGR